MDEACAILYREDAQAHSCSVFSYVMYLHVAQSYYVVTFSFYNNIALKKNYLKLILEVNLKQILLIIYVFVLLIEAKRNSCWVRIGAGYGLVWL